MWSFSIYIGNYRHSCIGIVPKKMIPDNAFQEIIYSRRSNYVHSKEAVPRS